MTTTKKRLFIILALVGIILILLALLYACGPNGTGNLPPIPGITWDRDAEEGGLTSRSKEEIQAELNAKVSEGMINISINTAPVFPTGTAKGNLCIVNNLKNNYPQVVYINRVDTGEEIYRSGAIAVGSKIEMAKLNVDLDPGTYDCVAYFNNVDMETGTFIGTAGAEIKITVEG